MSRREREREREKIEGERCILSRHLLCFLSGKCERDFVKRNVWTLVDPATLRRAGWSVPARITSPFRVYDTRLSPKFHRGVLAKLGIPDSEQVKVVGGDFLTAEAMGEDVLTDNEALQDGEKWWVQGGHAWVNPPRESLRKWVDEICWQMDPTGAASISFAMFVDRDKVAAGADVAQILPALRPLFQVEGTTASAFAVGERVPLRRIPRNSKALPPSEWVEVFSPDNRVMVVVQVKRGVGQSDPRISWLGGIVPPPPPPPAQTGCEVLLAELLLPPGIRAERAAGFFQSTLRRVARENSLEQPLGDWRPRADGHLAWGTFKVPRGSALAWLKLSGKGGLFVRPFLSQATGPDCASDRFAVRWLRSSSSVDSDASSQVWERVKGIDGFFGLVLGKGDMGLRVAKGQDHESLC